MTDWKEENLRLDVSTRTIAYLLYSYLEDQSRFRNPYKTYIEETGQTDEFKKWELAKDKKVVDDLFASYIKEELDWIKSHKEEYIEMIKREKNE